MAGARPRHLLGLRSSGVGSLTLSLTVPRSRRAADRCAPLILRVTTHGD
jgi:hypothetical protein